jgi:ApaG protein
MYQAVTRQIRVSVKPTYLEDRSDSENNRYFWAYTITIANESPVPVQLQSRYWRITDANGHVEEVRGAGVVGETPLIAPGGSFEYTSGCPLPTPSGIMVGRYLLVTPDGASFEIDIPAFSLDSPHLRVTLN